MTGWCRTCVRRTLKSAERCYWCRSDSRVRRPHKASDISAEEIERLFQIAKAQIAYRRSHPEMFFEIQGEDL